MGLQPQSYPKALEHLTGLLQSATLPQDPAVSLPNAPVTLKPNGSVEEIEINREIINKQVTK